MQHGNKKDDDAHVRRGKLPRKSRLRRGVENRSNNNGEASSGHVSSSPLPSRKPIHPAATLSSPQPTHRKSRSISSLLVGLTVTMASFMGLSLVYVVVVLDVHEKTYDIGSSSVAKQKQPFFLRHNTNKISFPVLSRQVVHIDAAAAKTVRKDESNVIDMRQLNQQLPYDNPDGGAWKQGWDLQARPDNDLTVFVVPHSHNDPGWIKTFDDYFQSQTKHILTTIVQALSKDERRKFIWAEISYFEWWWNEQNEETRQLTRKLLDNQQLEFVTGGWVMPDEANSDLFAMEIQLVEGHDWIRENLGEQYIPRYGWSIDPFGYSPTMAWLLQKHGFRAMLVQRVHYAIKKELAKRKHLEFYWRQTWDDAQDEEHSRGEHDIFTHVMPFFSYDVPHTCGPDPSVCCQFDFKRGRGDCPWRKDPKPITSSNVKERAMLLWDQYKKKAALYRSNTVLIPLGDDFRYQTSREAEAQFTNYQLIFDYINQNIPGAHIQFGTLSEYFNSVMGTFDTPILKGSFFTYSDVNEDYWSGYFTSRVFDKALDRQLERTIYAAHSMGASKKELQEPRRALSLFQHHDGVTGTAKTHVVQDYAKRMFDAMQATQEWMVSKLKEDKLTLIRDVLSNEDDLRPCLRAELPRDLTLNRCGESRNVIAYNPLGTLQSCGAQDVPGKSFTKVMLPCDLAGPTPSSNANIEFDPLTGLMLKPVREEWKVWNVKAGGAYLFVPQKMTSYDLKDHNVVIEEGGFIVTTDAWKRTVVEREVPEEFGSTATVFDFIYETHLTIDNQEWFTRFSAGIANDGTFHTDLNGFDFDTHHFRRDMPIQSQVFPMPTLASIEDSKRRLTVLSEHAQGTASLEDGSIDVWLDRRLRQDDGRGLGQGVQDNRPTRTKFRVLVEQDSFTPSEEFIVTELGQRMWDELQHPLEFFGKHISANDEIVNPEQWRKAAKDREEARAERRRQLNAAKQKWLDVKDAKDKKQPLDGKYHNPLQKYASDFRHFLKFSGGGSEHKIRPLATRPDLLTAFVDIVARQFSPQKTIVPFVFMVHKRVEYLKKAIASLRKSDFPKNTVPLIISHDGRVPEMMTYVDSLKEEFNIVQIFHPFSCFEHPDSFPGQDPTLNVGYKGDMYGNPREGWATCCKHHFTWLMKTVFSMDFGKTAVDSFLFIEEDYVVGPSVYSTVIAGLNTIKQFEKETDGGFVGVGLDVTEANTRTEPLWIDEDAFIADIFHSGPMTMSRSVFNKLRDHAEDYCRFDDYNWDWSYVHSAGMGHVPHTVLFPTRSQAKHIGIKEGMHADQMGNEALRDIFPDYGDHFEVLDTKFEGKRFYGSANVTKEEHPRGYGGWGHPADQEHCLKLLRRKSEWMTLR